MGHYYEDDVSPGKLVAEAKVNPDLGHPVREVRMEAQTHLQTCILLDIRDQLYYADQRFHDFRNDLMNYPLPGVVKR